MATIFRGAGATDTTSEAEKVLVKAFKSLSDDFTIIHSAKWIAHRSKSAGTVGEADFVIAHPQHGVLIVEVKGGTIQINRNKWFSVSKSGDKYEIKDPFDQADRNTYNLRDWLQNDRQTKRFTYPIFSVVAFPDMGVMTDLRPDAPREIMLDGTRLATLEKSLLEVYKFWQIKYPNLKMSGKGAVDALRDLLVPSTTLHPAISIIFERERQKIDELTERQFQLLKFLQNHHRAAIVGGAGTGKTMLAMEKAKQLANASFRVLFLCFNKNLANWISANLTDEHIFVSTFHSLVGHACVWAKLPRPQEKSWERFRESAPDLLLDAINIIRAPGSGVEDKLFDAILVDEAQDFEETWWIPVRDLLKEPETGVLYVFFDDNQRIYTQIAEVPMQTPPFVLNENCRNTQAIHRALVPYISTGDQILCNGPEGRAVEIMGIPDAKSAADVLKAALLLMVDHQGIAPQDIIILTPRSEQRSQWHNDQQMGTLILTWNMDTDMPRAIRVCTIYSFKGLESPVIILTEMDQVRDDIRDQLIYVGLSRARNAVVVIGELPKPTNG